MNFASIGSLNNYINNLKLRTNWEMRKAHSDFSPNERFGEAYSMWENFMEQNSGDNKKLADLYAKIQSGSELTNEEMEFLRKNNPDLYSKLRNQEIEDEAFKKKLENCKSKEDVQKAKLDKMNQALSKMKTVSNNPNISDDQKLAIFSEVNAEVLRCNKITDEFIQSGDYSRLPDKNEDIKNNSQDNTSSEDTSDIYQENIEDDVSLEFEFSKVESSHQPQSEQEFSKEQIFEENSEPQNHKPFSNKKDEK